jgi:hypothetical protein
MAYVKLYLPDTPTTAITVLCGVVTCGGKKNTETTPAANVDGPIIVQTQSFENITISLSNVQFTQGTDTLTWSDILSLYSHKFADNNPAYLEVQYGKGDTIFNLTGTAGTTKIPVILQSFSLPIDTRISVEGKIPTAKLTFIETDTE